jgi:hypothetical protein
MRLVMAFHNQVGGWRWSVAMPTMNECQHKAELCLRLASETKEFYAKIALFELAKEFRALAEHSEPARVANQNYVWRY